MMTCKFCRSVKLVKRRKEPHVGIYCVACGKWQQWVKQNSPKFEEVPWDLDDKSLKKLMANNTIKLPEDSIFSSEEYKAFVEGKFPERPDDKPPWED